MKNTSDISNMFINEHTIVPFAGGWFFVQELEITPNYGKPSVIKHIVLSQIEDFDIQIEEEDVE